MLAVAVGRRDAVGGRLSRDAAGRDQLRDKLRYFVHVLLGQLHRVLRATHCATELFFGKRVEVIDVSDRERPLEGVRVIELGQLLAGPFTGTILAYFGAEVIKVESPGGDPIRGWRLLRDGTSLWYRSVGRNKKSVTLDLKSERGRTLAGELIDTADVVIENFRPDLPAVRTLGTSPAGGFLLLTDQFPAVVKDLFRFCPIGHRDGLHQRAHGSLKIIVVLFDLAGLPGGEKLIDSTLLIEYPLLLEPLRHRPRFGFKRGEVNRTGHRIGFDQIKQSNPFLYRVVRARFEFLEMGVENSI